MWFSSDPVYPMNRARSLAFFAAALVSPAAVSADEVARTHFFREQVEPILRDHCYKCHSHGADKVKGGLLLDSRAAALEGGDSGAVLVPGDPDKSLLIEAVRYR